MTHGPPMRAPVAHRRERRCRWWIVYCLLAANDDDENKDDVLSAFLTSSDDFWALARFENWSAGRHIRRYRSTPPTLLVSRLLRYSCDWSTCSFLATMYTTLSDSRAYVQNLYHSVHRRYSLARFSSVVSSWHGLCLQLQHRILASCGEANQPSLSLAAAI